MLARSTALRHPSGTTVKTPLLVPSFSSKGLLEKNSGRSELRGIFTYAATLLAESMLVSAYDIHYEHLPKPQRFPCTPSITFVDSGGYETNPDYDLYQTARQQSMKRRSKPSVGYRYGSRPRRWRLIDYRSVLDHWPERVPAVLVSFDKDSAGKSVGTQIDAARRLFERYPKQLHAFLIKPSGSPGNRITNMVNEIGRHARDLTSFSVIGVTDKDLGNSTLERMLTIARVRAVLDGEGVKVPIQIFGALDPVVSPLYFLAGAEIFDGLTWLRFAYCDHQWVYESNYGVVHVGIDPDDDFVKSKILADNYASLRNLQLAMHRFRSTEDFSHFGPHADVFKRATESLNASLRGVG